MQGIGFRPFVYRLAHALGMGGWVRNESGRVTIEIEGPQESTEAFVERLKTERPAWARYERFEVSEVPTEGETRFAITASEASDRVLPGIPPDLAVCEKCLAEMADPDDRRYRYPFINCTECGPRWSIIEGVPYDRPLTSMRIFEMCDDCRREYESPLDRRFHAQPIACPRCGPQLALIEPSDVAPRFSLDRVCAKEEEALQRAARAVLEGKILALKGLGGYQLVCDATDEEAVLRLRERKRRPDKPFAVMVTAESVPRYVEVPAAAREALHSGAAPIVLLKRRPTSQTPVIAEAVAPDNPYLGVMVPYTPLHHLLLGLVERPVVCTSGNLSEEPMAIDDADALRRLGEIADVFLLHDRPIVRPVDDSVVMPDDRAPGIRMVRRARGYAPQPLVMPCRLPVVLAVGGHLKNTTALSIEDRIVVSSHVGDLDNRPAVAVHRRVVDDLLRFFRRAPECIACDLHPDYASTRVAEDLAARFGVPLVRVQHHEAHLAAVLAEAEHHDKALPPLPVLGVSWDGTGYGRDGSVWGGEFFLFDGDTMRRAAHLRRFRLPGGDKAVREPRRSALGVFFELEGENAFAMPGVEFSEDEARIFAQALSRRIASPLTSSMGRLFDTAAAVCGFRGKVGFEGRAAVFLEFAAERFLASVEHMPDDVPFVEPCRFVGDDPITVDWEPLIRSLAEGIRRGLSAEQAAFGFHAALADVVAQAAAHFDVPTVALGGGCFLNRVLVDQIRRRLPDRRVLVGRELPCGDGSIAVGQLWLAAREYRREAPVDHAVD
ncbi:carbamoyltransferase HypF [Thermostilla marina]